jgi:hypothetical protein
MPPQVFTFRKTACTESVFIFFGIFLLDYKVILHISDDEMWENNCLVLG